MPESLQSPFKKPLVISRRRDYNTKWRTKNRITIYRKDLTIFMNKDLTVGNPQTVLWKFCLPMFGSIIFQQLYNIADSLVAGKFISENALAAVGNSYNVTLIFIAFAFRMLSNRIAVFRREKLS